MKRTHLFFISIGFIAFGIVGCKDDSKLNSDDFDSAEERVEVLQKEIKSFSPFENAEFELFNVNGFSNSSQRLPGASCSDYKFAIKLDPSRIDDWTKGMRKIEPEEYNDDWIRKIIKKNENDWKIQSEPEYYTRENEDVTAIVHRAEGIIFKRVITQ